MSTWIGRKKIAFIPVYRPHAIPPDQIPTDWSNQIMRRVLFDPDQNSGADRSLRAYIRAASSGRADFDVVVMPMATIDPPDHQDVKLATLDGLLDGPGLRNQGFDAAAIVMLGGKGAGTSERGGFWARFVMVENVGVWAMELMHVLTGFYDLYTLGPNGYTDYPYGDIGRFDEMSCSCGTHPSAYTKAAIGWLDDSAIAKHTGRAAAYALHAVGLTQPPPSGRSTAVRIGSEVPYLMVEARLMVDQFESPSQLEPGIPSQGVIIYRVQTSDASALPQNNVIPVFLLTNTALAVGQSFTSDTNISISVTGAIPGGFLVIINDGNFADNFIVDPGTAVTALSRFQDHLDLFVVGRDGAVYSTFWDTNGGWLNSWFRLGDGSFADNFTVDPGTTVTALSRFQDHLDLFVVGRDGAIFSTYWDANSGWAGSWFRIREGVAKPGSLVTAVARNPDHLDLFVTGTDGGIYSIYWDANGGWAGSWFRIREGVAKPGPLVTAVARNPDHLDLFVTGTDGGIYSIYWDANGGWAGSWFRIREGIAEVGSPVTAVARNPDHLDLFVTGTDGGIYSIYWDANGGWGSSWFRIREGVAKPGSLVTAVARNPDHFDLFVTGTDGGIYSIYWDANGGWGSSWFRIREGIAEVGSVVTSVARNPDHLDLFITGADGKIYSIYWDANSGWPNSWFRL